MTSFRESRRIVATLVGLSLAAAACASPGQTAAPQAPTAGATAIQASPDSAATASAVAEATPTVVDVEGIDVLRIPLGPGSAPVDVAFAFGSIWTADHRSNTVSRLDPGTYERTARIEVGPGPGWFAVTEDSVWVTLQMGRGLTRIDPATNTTEQRIGGWAPCGAPVLAEGSIWQAACDAGIIMRIDPETRASTDIYAQGYGVVGLAGETLLASSSGGVARIDPETNELVPLGFTTAFPIGFDATSIWVSDEQQVQRVSATDGTILATIPIAGEVVLSLDGERAWIAQFGRSVHRIDPETATLVRSLELHAPTVARELAGALWVTSFDASAVYRVDVADLER